MKIKATKGVHIFREFYLNTTIRSMPLPDVLKIPTDFCEFAVNWQRKKGDSVQKYDVIAIIKDDIPIYAPCTGVFEGFEIGPKLGFNNAMQYAIIRTDKEQSPSFALWPTDELPKNKAELSELVRKAAIVDVLRRRYLYVLLQSEKHYNKLLIDCVDDEPYDLSKTAGMLLYQNEVTAGAQIVADALNIAKKELLLFKNFATNRLFSNVPEGFKAVQVCGKYPAFPAVKQYAAKNKALRIDSESCRAIYRAAAFGEPQTTHTVTVWGEGVQKPQVLSLINGAPIKNVIEQCDATGVIERVVAGGLMTGYTAALEYPAFNWDCSINAVLNRKHHDAKDCTNCGRCAVVCPVGLAPYYTLRHTNNKGVRRAKQLCNEMCVHCGACAYICPARIPLDYHIRAVGQKGGDFNE